MPRYRVTLIAEAALSVEVEADDRESAIEAAYDNDQFLCSHCSGWGHDWGMDLGEWEADDTEGGVYEIPEAQL